MNPRDDVVKNYRMVPEDFVKHLFSTLAIVVAVVLLASIFFKLPEKQPLTIKGYSTAHPIQFEEVVLRALDGQGQIANYGPPYNHGTGNLESFLQQWAGILHPINAATDFVVKPLKMAESVNPAITPALNAFEHASKAQQALWEANYTKALQHANYKNGVVVTAPGNYGPLPALLNDALALGKSGLYSGALIRNPKVITRFDNQNYVLFLQGTPLQTDPATQSMAGPNWGIIHPAINGYPGAWWMTIPTWIYQWPFVANSSASDALALSIGFLFWLALALTPWIPGWNRLPRYLGVHRLIWRDFYKNQPMDTPPAAIEEGGHEHAS
ncbi:MAG: cytochrome B6 [Firmicutes bacterium]|nr:cytochrome B6 [Bacillota bacterium]